MIFPLKERITKLSQGQLGEEEGRRRDMQATHLILHTMMALPKGMFLDRTMIGQKEQGKESWPKNLYLGQIFVRKGDYRNPNSSKR